MKITEKDFEYLETSPELLKRGLRRISRPKSLDKRLQGSNGNKSRVTIYFDSDIIGHFKAIAERDNAAYQTLINDALRALVDGRKEEFKQQDLKEELLKDKKFLNKLKTALAR